MNMASLVSEFREDVDSVRLVVGKNTSSEHKANLGQFMTPSSTASFMASLFSKSLVGKCRLVDAGAGIGSLSAAFLDRWASGEFGFSDVSLTAYEFDPIMRDYLKETLGAFEARNSVKFEVVDGDFIEHAVLSLKGQKPKTFTHAILNPPYKKIGTDSRHRLILRKVGIETVNLYSAFTALVLMMMELGGQIVAIIPRSFCNGPYYKPFREIVLRESSILQIHLFASRNKAFKDDKVLQENVIIHLERGGKQGPVTISTSSDNTFGDYETIPVEFERIVQSDSDEKFIHIPTHTSDLSDDYAANFRSSLKDIEVEVSTGPVVDFRMQEFTHQEPVPGSVPLLYSSHFTGEGIEWPRSGSKKPNAIMDEPATRKWLYPNGFYTVVRRFSSKEEKRRITASVCDPNAFSSEFLGFENHLNVFHSKKRGLPENVARGLAVFLNSTMVDEHFRSFNGHTQVNATDLKLMKYPDTQYLIALGKWAKRQTILTQEAIDNRLLSSL